MDLILLLDEHGYPPVERDEVYVEIFEQAEDFKKNRKNEVFTVTNLYPKSIPKNTSGSINEINVVLPAIKL